MFKKTTGAREILNPVAISNKQLSDTSFTVLTHEFCTLCGAVFGICYQGEPEGDSQTMEGIEELPGRLTEILAKDHRHDRPHKSMIDLDLFLSTSGTYR